MSDLSPAARVQQLRDQLDWAASLLAAQPEPIRLSYVQAATTIAQSLKVDSRQLRLTLPYRVMDRGALKEAPRPLLLLRAGSLLTQLRRQPVREHIIAELQKMSAQKHEVVACCASLTAWEAARILMDAAISGEREVAPLPIINDEPTEAEIDAAKGIVNDMTSVVRWMRDAEALFPGWGVDDSFNETYVRLTGRLVAAGRALALWQTQTIIADLLTRYKTHQFLNGLKLYIPYLDERLYQMTEYPLDVVPSARIPFYPELLVSACRLAERDVRADPHFSQATRWQLLSQLDLLLHTFETVALRS